MAYEYEGTIESILMNMVNREQHKSDIYYLMADEVAEVYAKAKAFDEIKKLRNDHYIYSKTNSGTPIKVIDAKPFGREVSHLINKKGYMEDE